MSDDQSRLLEEAIGVTKVQSYQMQKCLEEHRLMDALKHCSTMLAELRTSALTPKSVDMSIFDALGFLTAYLKEAHTSGRHHLADLYELVQYAGNIVPRLYLMITVGAVYLGMPDAPVKELLRDMIEMSRGVQHPTRGLFLRHYLSGMTRDHLPMGKSDGPEGNLDDSVEFVLANFIEMNKLWVRLQHLGHSRDREKRELERKELRILVGTNLVRLSQLDGVDLGLYNKTILVAILEQVINCKDVIAQEYLMEVIIQAFPDDFHLHTLEQLMRACVKLHPRVSVRGIVVALLDRLVSYAQRENDVDEGEEKVAHGIPSDVRLFEVFWEQIQEILRSRKEISLQDITALMVSLANLALSCYPDRLEYVDQIFQFVCERETAYEQSPDLHHAETVKNNLALLCAPIYAYPNVLTILDLENYTALLHKQSSATRRSVAMAIVQTALKQDALIETVDDVDGVLNLCTVLIKENKDSVQGRFAGTEEANLEEEQGLLARLVHLFKSDNPDEQFLLLSMARKHFVEGNDRIRFTFPPIVFMALQLARRYKNLQDKDEEWTRKATTLFRFIHQLISVLYNKSDTHELALRLFLMAAQAADQCGFEENAYDFFVQAFTIYEESLSESRAQFQALTLIVGALQATRVFGADNYETLTHKCLLHSGRLLKRPDQCRAMCLCAHLFWATPSKWHTGGGEEEELYQDGVRVKETLQRALKIADACLDASINVQLFVEILNRYIYFFELGCQEVTPVYINGLFDLVHQNISTMDPAAKKDANATQLRNASTSALMESFDGSLAELVVKHFKATVKYMERRKQDAIDDNIAGVVERYSEIELVF